MSQQPVTGISYIPQDINLELNNGTLTLKSGSVITFQNGTQLQLTVDWTSSSASGSTYKSFVFCSNSGFIGQSASSNVLRVGSGSSLPADNTNYSIFFNSTDNKIYHWSSGAWVERSWCLPIAIVSVTSGVITSIDQVFNGFGYIGSSIFLLPGVIGYLPDGYDGFTPKFKNVNMNTLRIYTTTIRQTNIQYACSNSKIERWSQTIQVVNKLSDYENPPGFARVYVKQENKMYFYNNGWLKETQVPFGYVTTTSSSPYKITELRIVTPFLVNYFYDYAYASYKPLSQYANSPRFIDLYNNICGLFNNSKTLEDWFNVVYNLKTASGFGLDIWGTILNQGRQFSYEENGVVENIFLGGEQTIDGITYSAEYMEEMYRMVLFLRALGYITNCTLASLNNLLQYYFADKGRVYVINYGTMEIRYVFEFYASKLEKAIFTTDVLPKPTGVLANFEYIPLGEYFGFYVDGIADPEDQPFAPFDNKPFYS